MRIVELRTEEGRSIARARMAHTFSARWMGLFNETELAAREGLLLIPGKSVHTAGLRYPIDVVFLDRQLRIVRLLPNLLPWRFASAPNETRIVLELRAGRIAEVGLTLNASVCACFDDDETEEILPGVRAPVCNRATRPRPVSPCIRFSLRLPLEREP